MNALIHHPSVHYCRLNRTTNRPIIKYNMALRSITVVQHNVIMESTRANTSEVYNSIMSLGTTTVWEVIVNNITCTVFGHGRFVWFYRHRETQP